MKKFLLNGFFFLVLVIIIYLTAFFVLGNIKLSGEPLINWLNPNLSAKGTIHRANLEFKKDGPFDVAVFGSSHAYRGYDPRIFKQEMGLKMFNFGSSAQSLPNTCCYLQNQCDRNEYKVVVLDLLVSIFENKELESSIILTRNVADDALARDILFEEKDIRLLNIYLARHLIQDDHFYFRNPDYVQYGFVAKTDSMSAPNVERAYEKFRPNPRAVKRFKDILAYCRTNKIPLVLVNQPRPIETNRRKNQEFSDFLNECNKEYNFPLFDYSMNHGLETNFNFYDLGHMNQTGVEYFNRRLIADLKILLSQKQEKGYAF